jgi:hypothetical protein
MLDVLRENSQLWGPRIALLLEKSVGLILVVVWVMTSRRGHPSAVVQGAASASLACIGNLRARFNLGIPDPANIGTRTEMSYESVRFQVHSRGGHTADEKVVADTRDRTLLRYLLCAVRFKEQSDSRYRSVLMKATREYMP